MSKLQGAAIILLNSQRQVLLVLRDDKDSIPYPNTWNILGGCIEENESPEECIKREMLEEIELDVGEINFFRSFDLGDRIDYAFWKKIDLEPSKINLHEGQRLAYFTKAEIDKMEIAFQGNRILDAFFPEVIS